MRVYYGKHYFSGTELPGDLSVVLPATRENLEAVVRALKPQLQDFWREVLEQELAAEKAPEGCKNS